MPDVTWSLVSWHNQNAQVTVTLDPALIDGHRGVFGPALILPFKVTPALWSSSDIMLHTLEGWILWNSDPALLSGIRIPSQTIGANNSTLLAPLTDEQIEAIEWRRDGGAVIVNVGLSGLATIPHASVKIAEYVTEPNGAEPLGPRPLLRLNEVRETTNTARQVRIERERWVEIVERLGAGRRRLVELPDPELPAEEVRWEECMRLLTQATQLFRSGYHDQVLKNCPQSSKARQRS